MKTYKKVSLLTLALVLPIIALGAKGCPWIDKDEDTIAGSSAPLPSAVSNLTATTVSLSQIDLSWTDNSDNEDSFKIERKTGTGGTFTQIDTVSANVITYSDTGLTDGTTYYYRVRAYKTGVNSYYSNEAGATTLSIWTEVSGGTVHTIARKTNGTLWAWGGNTYSQLGLGDTTQRLTPTQVGTGTDWVQVSAGNGYTIARKTDNTIWAWGLNYYGHLGFGNPSIASPVLTPTQVGTDTDWAEVTAGPFYIIARKTNNTLWAWGDNNVGQLGLGDMISRTAPTQIGFDTDWREVAMGKNGNSPYTLGLKDNGTLWAWGWNDSGQLGLGDTISRTAPAQVGLNTNWAEVSAGKGHTVARKTNGTLWAWGRNSSGQLGLGNADSSPHPNPVQAGTDTDWTQVSAAAPRTTFALKTNGTLWAWGNNDRYLLGLYSLGSRKITPTQVGTDTDWAQVVASWEFALALKTDQSLWSWGINSSGQLGAGIIQYSQEITQVGH